MHVPYAPAHTPYHTPPYNPYIPAHNPYANTHHNPYVNAYGTTGHAEGTDPEGFTTIDANNFIQRSTTFSIEGDYTYK